MFKMKIGNQAWATAAVCIIFVLICAVFVIIPGKTVQHKSSDAQLMQGANDAQTAYTEVTPGEYVNINTADEQQLQALPGIGPELARRIVEYRQENGAFTAAEEIMGVNGIGQGRFEAIRELICTEDGNGDFE